MRVESRNEPFPGPRPAVPQPRLKTSRVEFILVCVGGQDDELAERIRGVCEIAERHGADFEIAGSLVILTYGTLAQEPGRHVSPGQVIPALQAAFGPHLKILRGTESGASGFLVGQQRVSYNVFLPHLSEARHAVETLDWGQLREFSPD